MRFKQALQARRLAGMAEFLGLNRSIVALLGMVILVGLGEKMAERFLPLYLMALGGGAFAVGLLNGLDNLLSALYSFPGGYASDRLGYKRALLVFNLLAMFGFLMVVIFPYWQAVIIGAFFFLSWTAISLPATMDMVAKLLPQHKRTMGVSVHSLVRRIPMALGPLLGGWLIGWWGEINGVRLAFGVALFMAAVSLVIQQLLIDDDRPAQALPTPAPRLNWALLAPPLRQLLLPDILVRFCEQIPYAFVVIWCVTLNGITPLQFGLLTTIEMVTAILIYIPVAYLADKSTKKPFVVITFGFFTLFPLLLLWANSFGVMVVAFIVRGLKEFGEPTRKALILDLAAEDQKAGTFGVYYLVRDLVVSVAALAGAFLWSAETAQFLVDRLGFGYSLLPLFEQWASPATNFLAAFGFGLAGTLYFALKGEEVSYPGSPAGPR
ncbi:MAG: MFS transporter [Anaerolineales bacterium]|nr:MFS transporter [Anaerolineales bacterium]